MTGESSAPAILQSQMCLDQHRILIDLSGIYCRGNSRLPCTRCERHRLIVGLVFSTTSC